jgi:hypothetical protein
LRAVIPVPLAMTEPAEVARRAKHLIKTHPDVDGTPRICKLACHWMEEIALGRGAVVHDDLANRKEDHETQGQIRYHHRCRERHRQGDRGAVRA